jgi:hypothetical protein
MTRCVDLGCKKVWILDMLSHENIKVFFKIGEEDQSEFEGEWLWCRLFPNGTCIVDNSPFRIFGVSFGDMISVSRDGNNFIFSSVIKSGGHSTYRVILPTGKDHEYFLQHWDEFSKFECTYEGANGDRRLYSIDIPNLSDVEAVYSLLQNNENSGIWEFEEAHYAG